MSVDNNVQDRITGVLWEEYRKVMIERFGRAPKKTNQGPFVGPYAQAFSEMAVWCMEQDVDPRAYIDAVSNYVYEEGDRVKPLTLPADYNRAETRNRYLMQKQNNTGGDPATQWNTQWHHVRRSMQTAPELFPDEQAVLRAPGGPYAAWFRVLYFNPPLPLIMRYYGKLAHEEIKDATNLRDFLRQHTPAALRALEAEHGAFPS
jgi:hypothetical protein